MASGRIDGWLVLADISGYTRFVADSDLERGHAVVEDLLRTTLDALCAPDSPLSVVKLEGDAVLCRGDGAVSGDRILERVEDTYHAFRMHLFSLDRQGRCDCFSCGAAQALDLKFVVHRGPYIVHRLAGHEDLSGTAVIAAHRLLKNTVIEATGYAAYALFTDEARACCDPGVPFREHVEAYEHLGEIRCGVLNLARTYIRLSNGSRQAVTEDDADATVAYELDATLPEAWAWHLDPARRAAWDPRAEWTMAADAHGLGAEVDASAAQCALRMRIVEWRPYASVTFDARGIATETPGLRTTYAFDEVAPGRVRVVRRLRILDREADDAAFREAWARTEREAATAAADLSTRIAAERATAPS